MANPIDFLVFRARVQPEAIALQEPERQLTYMQLLRLVKRIACQLRQQGVQPGQIAVTAFTERNIEWIVTLALIHEATITSANQGYAPVQALDYDWMLTDREGRHCQPGKTILVDNDWLREAQRQPADRLNREYESEDSPFRLILTSGTTGKSRAVLYSLGRTLGNTRQHTWNGDHSRALVLFGMSSGVGFRSGLYTLLTGFPFYTATDMSGNVALLRKFALGTVAGAPFQLSGLVTELKRSGIELPSLESVRCGGGAATPQLFANLRSGLCANISNNYGSTEVGNTCLFKPLPDMTEIPVGHALPGVQVQVVGDSRQALPPGEEGSVRVRGRFMATGYYNNPQASSERFIDGWFYPGDRGRQHADGCLQLSGRDSELINLGGTKHNPELIDQFVKDYPGVDDAAAFSVIGNAGVERLAVVLKVASEFDLSALAEALTKRFGQSCHTPFLVRTEQIPRTAMGKVQRRELRDRLQDKLLAVDRVVSGN